MFYIGGISISFFLSLVLFSKKGATLADKILASWLLVVGAHLFIFYAGITGFIYNYPWLLGMHLPIPLLHGPFLYLYVSAQTNRLTTWTFKSLLHFIPVILDYIYLIHYFISPVAYKVYVYKNQGAGYELYMRINITAIILSGIAYVAGTILLLRKHRKQIRHEFSSTEKINLVWVNYLTLGIALIWLFVILRNDNLVFGAAVLFVVFIGYFGIRQVGIFSASTSSTFAKPAAVPENIERIRRDERNEGEALERQKKKYSRSGLTEDMAMQIQEKLAEVMKNEKLFAQCELTLTELAVRLAIHPNHLSQVINEREGQSFYDYIHTLRVEEFKSRLLDSDLQKYTLLSLAFESGFNSKSTFNKYFRKISGISPSEYLQQVRKGKLD